MNDRTNYTFRVRVPCAAPGEPRPVMIAARMARVISDALTKDGLKIHANALPYGVSVECVAMEHVEIEEGSEGA